MEIKMFVYISSIFSIQGLPIYHFFATYDRSCRSIVTKRNWLTNLLMFLIPILFIAAAVVSMQSVGLASITHSPSRILSLKQYPNDATQAKLYFAGMTLYST